MLPGMNWVRLGLQHEEAKAGEEMAQLKGAGPLCGESCAADSARPRTHSAGCTHVRCLHPRTSLSF